jgi:hypothetical protein
LVDLCEGEFDGYADVVSDDFGGSACCASDTVHGDDDANPLTRFLHKQAHGAALPVFGKMERRAELINDIARHAPPVAAALGGPASSQPSVDVPPPTA